MDERESSTTEEATTLNSVSAKEGESSETDFDPIQAINEIKKKTVSKDEYNKVKADRDKYLKALLEGSQGVGEKKEPANIDELRKKLFSGNLNNLDYIDTSLKLRDALMDRDGVDIFVAKGNKISPSNEDYEAAQRVADVFNDCVKVAEGDSEIFTRELMRRTIDIAPQSRINPKIRR